MIQQRVRVVIVDDHAMFRVGVKAELGDAVDVVGEGYDVDSAVATIEAQKPAVVLLDVHLPGGGGVEVIRRAHAHDTRYLALSVSDAAEDVIGTIRGGARAMSPRRSLGPSWSMRSSGSTRRRGVLAATGWLRPRRVRRLDRGGRRRRGPRPPLGARAGGDAADRPRYAYKEVAKELFISIKTVETHMSSVLRKLQLSSRHELTKWASDRRLLLRFSGDEDRPRRPAGDPPGGHRRPPVGLLAQVTWPEKKVNGLMRDGIGTAFLAGIFLVGVLEAVVDLVDDAKIAVKFAIGPTIRVPAMANLRKERIPFGLYWGLLSLTFANIGVALIL